MKYLHASVSARWQLVCFILYFATLRLIAQIPSNQPQNTASHSTASPLVLPKANACQSTYDFFYESEEGVYAYWPLCEAHPDEIGYDYLGEWPLVKGFQQNIAIDEATSGPVPDGESAARSPDAEYKLEQQGIFVNKHAGTLAAWINAEATDYPVTAESFTAMTGKSRVAISVFDSGKECFAGNLSTSTGEIVTAKDCHYSPNTWHRVVVTWGDGRLTLYVDGEPKSSIPYRGLIDDSIFYYQLFPGCCKTGKQMTLAKVSVANRSWSAKQVAEDFTPALITPPRGGVEVTNDSMGTIHQDVLGYVDYDQDLSNPAAVLALKNGLHAAGMKALRYTGGDFAEAEDWRGGATECTAIKGKTVAAHNVRLEDHLDTYMTRVAEPLHLSVDFVVNYGSNPPSCNAGGDPVANAGDLVRYANVEKKYHIGRWEIGNEQYAYGGGPLIDLHPNEYITTNGRALSSYTTYEPSFYEAMKVADPTIKIAVPSIVGPYASYNALIHYQLPLLTHAKFDALVLHAYPIVDPISDGNTIYPDRVASGTQIRGTLLAYQTQLLDVEKPPDAVWVTEWDAQQGGNLWSKQTIGAAMPLFAAMQLAEYMQAGVQFASWQAQGEASGCSAYNYDRSAQGAYTWWDGCGDAALIYTGPVAGVGEQFIGMRPGDLTPAARAFQLLSQSGFVTEGEHMLRTQSDPAGAPWLMAYASTHGASYSVLLINRDRDRSHSVPVAIQGIDRGGQVSQWSYGKEQYDHTREGNWSVGPANHQLNSWSGTFDANLPPWSINVFVFTDTPQPKPTPSLTESKK